MPCSFCVAGCVCCCAWCPSVPATFRWVRSFPNSASSTIFGAFRAYCSNWPENWLHERCVNHHQHCGRQWRRQQATPNKAEGTTSSCEAAKMPIRWCSNGAPFPPPNVFFLFLFLNIKNIIKNQTKNLSVSVLRADLWPPKVAERVRGKGGHAAAQAGGLRRLRAVLPAQRVREDQHGRPRPSHQEGKACSSSSST